MCPLAIVDPRSTVHGTTGAIPKAQLCSAAHAIVTIYKEAVIGGFAAGFIHQFLFLVRTDAIEIDPHFNRNGAGDIKCIVVGDRNVLTRSVEAKCVIGLCMRCCNQSQEKKVKYFSHKKWNLIMVNAGELKYHEFL
jgi:hypothetical protein